MFVKLSCPLILCMDDDGTDASNVGGLDGPEHCILQKRFAYSSLLPSEIHRKAGKQHDRNGTPRTTFL